MYNCGSFTDDRMNYYRDLSKADRDYDNTVVYFEGPVECMYQFTEHNGSTTEARGFKSVANVGERR